jgi:hypothetical protein
MNAFPGRITVSTLLIVGERCLEISVGGPGVNGS